MGVGLRGKQEKKWTVVSKIKGMQFRRMKGTSEREEN